jgi:tRNA (Thr-GGU) A37 N-methylase
VFDRNSDSTSTFKSKIKAPKLVGEKTGVFATRSPHRMNPIGLSLAKLEDIRENVVIGSSTHVVLELSGIDLVHNTPVLDIKPYHPADNVPQESLRFPDWVKQGPSKILDVSFTEEAGKTLFEIFNKLKFYKTPEEARQVIVECLRLDPRTTHSRNKAHKLYGMAIDRMDISFTYLSIGDADQVLVLEIKLCSNSRNRMRTREWYEVAFEESKRFFV